MLHQYFTREGGGGGGERVLLPDEVPLDWITWNLFRSSWGGGGVVLPGRVPLGWI